jgi:hypothetical protein
VIIHYQCTNPKQHEETVPPTPIGMYETLHRAHLFDAPRALCSICATADAATSHRRQAGASTLLRNSQLAARLLSIRYRLAFCAVPSTMVENDDTHHPAHLSLLGQ